MRTLRRLLLIPAALVITGCVTTGGATRNGGPEFKPGPQVESMALQVQSPPPAAPTGQKSAQAPDPKAMEKAAREAALAPVVNAWMTQIDQAPGEALRAYPGLAKALSDRWEVHYNGGLLYMKLNRPEEAQDAFNRAMKLKAPPEKIYNALGIVYYETGRKNEAADALKKAFGYDWKSQALINIGNVYMEIGKYDDAVGYYRDAEALDPNNPMLHYNKGILFYRKGNYRKALEEFEKVPGAEDALKSGFCKAQSLLKTGRYEESLKLFKKLAEKDTNNFYLYKHIGIIYEIYLGNPEKAFENYTAYLSHVKEDKDVQAWQDITRTKIMNKEQK